MSKTHTDVPICRSSCASSYRKISLMLLSGLCAAQLLMIAGCHRGFYRRQADAEAKRLIAQKTAQRWDSATGEIEINPMSRMFDPFSADHPPIPPDDPTSHELMKQVDCKPGYPHWHANGDINSVENPEWMSYLPVNEDGQLVLSLSDAYRLALIHSTDLQQQRETLYLSALEVSIQRFGFDSQLFAGFNSFLNSQGRFRTGTGSSSTTLESSLGSTGGGLSARRLGITGANFVAGLANTILWEFSGTNTQSANSLINFSLIQPLLRGAGRERIMESLTQAERTLLANVRQLERFRRGFYLEIATGRDAGAGPSQTSASFLNSPGLSSSNVGGYIGLLQQKQQIKNLEFGVAQFEALLVQFSELYDADRINKLQVAQFEGSVYGQQQRLLSAKIAYQNALDRFKVTLGLPQDVQILIEDPFLEAFNLIDDQFPQQLDVIKKLRDETGDLVVAVSKRIGNQDEADDGAAETIDGDLKAKAVKLLPNVKRAERLIESILEEDRAIVARDIAALGEKRDERLQYLSKVVDDIESGRLVSRVEPTVFEPDSVPQSDQLSFELDGKDNKRSLVALLEDAMNETRKGIEEIEEFESSDELEPSDALKTFIRRIPDLFNEVNGFVLEMALLQAQARANSVGINDVDIDSRTAFETARCFRRDWMNARAALVDRWRQIEFFADQLESQVDLVLTGEIGNANADNPFRIRYEDGNLRAGFRFDAPIVRQSERNAYRQAQISYQQSRRSYYRFEDAIAQGLRLTLRTIDQNKVLFELNRTNLQNSIVQVQLNRANLFAPPPVGQRISQSDTTAQFLASAIANLTSQQDAFLSQWAQYEVLRRNLDFDMGTMQLDENFEWIDPGEIDGSIGARVAALEGIASNDRFCCGVQSAQLVSEDSYEVIDSTMVDVSETDDVIEAPVTEESAPSTEKNLIEVESDSGTPANPQIFENPPVQVDEPPDVQPPGIELLPLGNVENRVPVKALVGQTLQTTFSKSGTSRVGRLDPFRIASPPKKQKLVANATSTTECDDSTVKPNESLMKAFKEREKSNSAEHPDQVEAVIKRR